MLSPNFYNTIFVFPILNLLVTFYKLFLLIHLPGALGWAIIFLTAFIRLLLHPFFDQQVQTSKKMQDIKPRLDQLSAKHKKDPKKLQIEQMRLYKEAGVNPAAGCLFLIIQIPIFIALYSTLNLFLTQGTTGNIINSINNALYFSFLKITTIDPWFFGFNLALTPAKGGVWYYYLIPVVTGVLQYFQAIATVPPPQKKEHKKEENKVEKKEGAGDDFQKAMQTQMKYFFPILIGWFSYSLPVGLSLYWNIFSLFSIIHYKKAHSKEKFSMLDTLTH
ncbi:YidC/Oxa1 family membrane protein insertase [Candidatus Roizmanbacteria bacterium]|nr:YidC/Oxa1 family membrane protein insertase [Candidatus Roizmanbacteria bacterium]